MSSAVTIDECSDSPVSSIRTSESTACQIKYSRHGLAAAAFILVAALLELFGVIARIAVWGAVLALPVFAYEMSLTGRGFSDSTTSSEAEEAGRDAAE